MCELCHGLLVLGFLVLGSMGERATSAAIGRGAGAQVPAGACVKVEAQPAHVDAWSAPGERPYSISSVVQD